ncbi:MAG TPA: hypothetical protein VMF90_20240 [Rhizobiaceae bacterium]|nr:hypothetical protein [Rhizobiaceae bacterium]
MPDGSHIAANRDSDLSLVRDAELRVDGGKTSRMQQQPAQIDIEYHIEY